MSPHNVERTRQRPSLLPTPSEDINGRHRPSATYCYLLDADADLADEFDLRMRIAARQLATAEVIEIDVGDCDLRGLFGAKPPALGVLILDGVMTVDVRVGDRTATELVGAGDLLHPRIDDADDLVEHDATCHALLPTKMAVLDGAFAERIRPWPQITYALLRRTGRRASNVSVQRAIACQPRLDVRLGLLLWHFAARWGRVEPGGIRLSLPLTHRLLGRLVSAERPSVSHALARLADAGLVTGRTGELHLHGTLDEHLAALSARDDGQHPRALQRRAQ
jgi:CRP/FNR family transcriptional regulator, cyclic AMP receptor protein